MTQKIIVLFILSLQPWFSIVAQDAEQKYKIGVGVTAQQRTNNWGYDNLGVSFTPQITFTKKRHQFEIGPSFFYDFGRYDTKIGLLTGYKFYPNGFNNRFNASFYIKLPINFAMDNSVYSFYDIYIPSYDSITKDQFIAPNIQGGYGINLKITKGLYLGTDVGLGCGYIFRKTEYFPTGELETSSFKTRQLSFYTIIGLNLGYRF